MAPPGLSPRVDSVPDSSHRLSTTIIIGIAVIAVAAVALVVVLLVTYLRRRNSKVPNFEKAQRIVEKQPSIEKELQPADLQALRPQVSLARSVSRRNLTSSIILPSPVPPIPAARPRPTKNTSSASRPLSNAEVLAHHDATGTMPRPFGPVLASAFSSAPPTDTSPPSAGPFSFALKAPTARPSLDRTVSPAGASFHTAPSRPDSVASFSRQSILSASHNGSSLRASVASASSTGTASGEPLKVHHVFTPLLPDELVLRRGERVALVQAYDDGWYIVGRRAAWAAKTSRTAGPTQYAFGHPSARDAPDEVELGAVPAWVFQRSSGPHERPMRSASLGVTLVLPENERREDVMSWSNF